MDDLNDLKRPDHVDWHTWLGRHDRMQEQYFTKRDARFHLITCLIGETQERPIRVLDLGCGAGALLFSVLEALPEAQVIGIDLDPTVLWLSRARLEPFEERCRLIMADFLDPSWLKIVGSPLAAVVSAQTFHMLGAGQLVPLYRQIAEVIRPGGIFLNADHARSDSPAIQRLWERQRREVRTHETRQDVDEWDAFWEAYSRTLRVDISKIHERLYGGRERPKKERLPLVWHLNRMLDNGFRSAECFWRSEFDAVYGGVRGG